MYESPSLVCGLHGIQQKICVTMKVKIVISCVFSSLLGQKELYEPWMKAWCKSEYMTSIWPFRTLIHVMSCLYNFVENFVCLKWRFLFLYVIYDFQYLNCPDSPLLWYWNVLSETQQLILSLVPSSHYDQSLQKPFRKNVIKLTWTHTCRYLFH